MTTHILDCQRCPTIAQLTRVRSSTFGSHQLELYFITQRLPPTQSNVLLATLSMTTQQPNRYQPMSNIRCVCRYIMLIHRIILHEC
jgi:hypothetical protein